MLNLFKSSKPILGMVNLKTTVGYRGFTTMDEVVNFAVSDARNLIEGGVDGIMIENSNDHPHDPDIGPETVASMAIVVNEIVKISPVPVGVTIIMEPGDNSVLAVAKAAGASFVRSVSFNEAIVSNFGIYEGRPRRLYRYQKIIEAQDIRVFADVHVKHSTPLAVREIEESAMDAIAGGVDAIIVTGFSTGNAPALEAVLRVKKVAKNTPVLLGSGIKPENIKELVGACDGAIIGSYFKKDYVYSNPVDADKVREIMRLVKGD